MIRKAQIKDAKHIAELYISSSKAAYSAIVPENHLQNLNLEETTKQYAKKIQSEIENIYISEKNGILMGFIVFSKNAKFIELLQIYIDPIINRKGIGGKLISFLENFATNNNIDKILLWIIKYNESAIAFYKKIGFQNDQKERLLDKYKVLQVRFSKEITNGNST